MVTAVGTGHRVSPSAVMSLGIVGPFRAQVSCAVVCLDDRARTVAYISCLSTIAGTQVGCLRHRTIKALPPTSGGARILHVLSAMVAGWLQRHQQQIITYLLAANRILSERPQPDESERWGPGGDTHFRTDSLIRIALRYGASKNRG